MTKTFAFLAVLGLAAAVAAPAASEKSAPAGGKEAAVAPAGKEAAPAGKEAAAAPAGEAGKEAAPKA